MPRATQQQSGVSVVKPGRWAVGVFVVGLLLLLLVLFLMFKSSQQTTAQCGFAIVALGLAGAAFATALGGFLEVEIGNKKVGGYVRTGGALAVFVLILMKSPIECKASGGWPCDPKKMTWEEYQACTDN